MYSSESHWLAHYRASINLLSKNYSLTIPHTTVMWASEKPVGKQCLWKANLHEMKIAHHMLAWLTFNFYVEIRYALLKLKSQSFTALKYKHM